MEGCFGCPWPAGVGAPPRRPTDGLVAHAVGRCAPNGGLVMHGGPGTAMNAPTLVPNVSRRYRTSRARSSRQRLPVLVARARRAPARAARPLACARAPPPAGVRERARRPARARARPPARAHASARPRARATVRARADRLSDRARRPSARARQRARARVRARPRRARMRAALARARRPPTRARPRARARTRPVCLGHLPVEDAACAPRTE